jgi:hypothetical protein
MANRILLTIDLEDWIRISLNVLSSRERLSIMFREHGKCLFEVPITTIPFLFWNIPLGGTFLKFMSRNYLTIAIERNIRRREPPDRISSSL